MTRYSPKNLPTGWGRSAEKMRDSDVFPAGLVCLEGGQAPPGGGAATSVVVATARAVNGRCGTPLRFVSSLGPTARPLTALPWLAIEEDLIFQNKM
jgi:hypothetical protein